MKLIKNNQVIDAGEIATLYPDLTGPNVAAENGWSPVWPTTAEFDPMTQYAQEIAPAQDDKGLWRQQWQVLSLTSEQIAANQSAKVIQDNARIKAEIAEIEAKQPRATREAILTGSNTYLAILDDQINALRSKLS